VEVNIIKIRVVIGQTISL